VIIVENLGECNEEMYDILLKFSEETLNNTNRYHGWKIKIDGSFIKTRSGKSIWNELRHAKNALRNHFDPALSECRRSVYELYHKKLITYKELSNMVEEAYQQYIKDHVEFVEMKLY
jgi:hypothetical protein